MTWYSYTILSDHVDTLCMCQRPHLATETHRDTVLFEQKLGGFGETIQQLF